MSLPLSLPTVPQNWSCRSCGGCCRQHEILLTEAERRRILEQKWTEAEGAPAGMRAFQRVGGPWSRRYRLAHRPDGACVFLDESNRCRIHARFGEPAKPLPCRIYPFAFHPAGDKIALSLRFSCPSVTASDGTPLSQQRRDLAVFQDLVVPPKPDGGWPTPLISPGEQLDWPDTLRIVRRFGQLLCDGSVVGAESRRPPLARRLMHALFVAGMLGQAKFEKVRGGRVDDLMDALVTAAPLETAGLIAQPQEPSSLGKAQFRLVTAQYARRDTLASRGIGYRLRMAMAGARFARGRGVTPSLQAALRPVAFVELERPWDAAPDVERLLERYYGVKLAGMAFCGAACYGLPLVEGVQNLVLLYPVVMYIARWLALGQGRTSIALEDAQQALGIVDHHHGYSPVMGQKNFRQRVRWMVRHEEVGRLVQWYGCDQTSGKCAQDGAGKAGS